MVISMALMTPLQLNTYRGWLERNKTKFITSNPKPKRGSMARVELDWYNNEITNVNNWLKSHEEKAVRNTLENEAKRFMYPRAGMVTQVRHKGFARIKYAVKSFCHDFWIAFR